MYTESEAIFCATLSGVSIKAGWLPVVYRHLSCLLLPSIQFVFLRFQSINQSIIYFNMLRQRAKKLVQNTNVYE